MIEIKQNPEVLFEELEDTYSPRPNQMEIMRITKDNIMFLSNIKNQGVFLNSSDNQEYRAFMYNKQYRDILDDNIMDLSCSLVSMNKHMIKNFSRSKSYKGKNNEQAK